MKKIEQKITQLETQILENHITQEKKLLITEMKKIGIEKLPYSYSALKDELDWLAKQISTPIVETLPLHENIRGNEYYQ